MIKLACIIYYDKEKYRQLAENAEASFKHFNREIQTFVINPEVASSLTASSFIINQGVKKYMSCLEFMAKHNIQRAILLGADTITCARLDEFIDNNEDILATLDYPYRFVSEYCSSPDSKTHLNADVICINRKALTSIIQAGIKHKIYGEQGGLNEVVWSGKYSHTYRIVDYPYEESKVVYNARAKGNICAKKDQTPWPKYTQQFRIEEDKLFTFDNKQVKVWHYAQGFGTIQYDYLFDLGVRKCNAEWFNEETKAFFRSIGCKNYF